MSYDVASKELRLVRDQKATSQIAFMDSYHKLELGVDALRWNLDTSYLELQTLNRVEGKPVVIESYNYYDPNKLEKYRITSPQDPVTLMKRYFDSAWTRELPAADLAQMIHGGYTVQTILNTLFQLVEDGFIYYEPETQMVYIRQKVIDYIDASKGERDYDNMNILSFAPRENIRLDLENFNLGIKGVEKIAVSDSQEVVLFPYGQQFEMAKGRNMGIHGDIIAGRADFINAKFDFSYDDFRIRMDSIKKLLFYVPIEEEGEMVSEVDKENRKVKTQPIQTTIRDLEGVLMINDSDNKSGKVLNAEFPIFESEKEAFVYYENKKLYNGAYGKEQFFFALILLP